MTENRQEETRCGGCNYCKNEQTDAGKKYKKEAKKEIIPKQLNTDKEST